MSFLDTLKKQNSGEVDWDELAKPSRRTRILQNKKTGERIEVFAWSARPPNLGPWMGRLPTEFWQVLDWFEVDEG